MPRTNNSELQGKAVGQSATSFLGRLLSVRTDVKDDGRPAGQLGRFPDRSQQISRSVVQGAWEACSDVAEAAAGSDGSDNDDNESPSSADGWREAESAKRAVDAEVWRSVLQSGISTGPDIDRFNMNRLLRGLKTAADITEMYQLDLEEATTADWKGQSQFRLLPDRYAMYCEVAEVEPGTLSLVLTPHGELHDGQGYRPRFFDDQGQEIDEEGIIQRDPHKGPVFTTSEIITSLKGFSGSSSPSSGSSSDTVRAPSATEAGISFHEAPRGIQMAPQSPAASKYLFPLRSPHQQFHSRDPSSPAYYASLHLSFVMQETNTHSTTDPKALWPAMIRKGVQILLEPSSGNTLTSSMPTAKASSSAMRSPLSRDWLNWQRVPYMSHVDFDCDGALGEYSPIEYGDQKLCVGCRWFSSQAPESLCNARTLDANRKMVVVPTFYRWDSGKGVPQWRDRRGIVPTSLLGALTTTVPKDWHEIAPATLRRLPHFSLQDGLRHYAAVAEASVELLRRTHGALEACRSSTKPPTEDTGALEVTLPRTVTDRSKAGSLHLSPASDQLVSDSELTQLEELERSLHEYFNRVCQQVLEGSANAQKLLDEGLKSLCLPEAQRKLLVATKSLIDQDRLEGTKYFDDYAREMAASTSTIHKAIPKRDHKEQGSLSDRDMPDPLLERPVPTAIQIDVSDEEKRMPWLDLLTHYTARQVREGLWVIPRSIFTPEELLPDGELRPTELASDVEAHLQTLMKSMHTDFSAPQIPLRSVQLRERAGLVGLRNDRHRAAFDRNLPQHTGLEASTSRSREDIALAAVTSVFIQETLTAQRELEQISSTCQTRLTREAEAALGGPLTDAEKWSFAATQVPLDSVCWQEHHALTALRLRACGLDGTEVNDEASRRAAVEHQQMLEWLPPPSGSGSFAEWIGECKQVRRQEAAQQAAREVVAALESAAPKQAKKKGVTSKTKASRRKGGSKR